MGYHSLWVITALIQYVLKELVDSKYYGLLWVITVWVISGLTVHPYTSWKLVFYELSLFMALFKCVIDSLNSKLQWLTVKPEITHTLGGHQILWVITSYGFNPG